MRKSRTQASNKDPSRQILGVAIALVGLGVVLLVVSIAFATQPRLEAVGRGFRIALPYVFLLGLGLLAVYGLLRRKPDEASRRPHEPTLFGKDSTEFPSQLDRGTYEDPDPTMPADSFQRPPTGNSRSHPRGERTPP